LKYNKNKKAKYIIKCKLHALNNNKNTMINYKKFNKFDKRESLHPQITLWSIYNSFRIHLRKIHNKIEIK